MSFPIDPLPMKSELFIDGAWVDVTALGRVRNDSDVVITRGNSNEQTSLSPCTCALTINNRDGLFSNKNPLSTYYKKLRRNIPFRQSLTESVTFVRFPQWLSQYTTSLSGVTTLAANQDTGGRVYTADKAVLDITGDIDIRVEVEPENWVSSTDYGMFLAMKWDSNTNNRSWNFYVTASGLLGIATSSAGSAITYQVNSTEAIDISIARQALRVTVDVNNGAGGADFRFYTSDSITGTWTQLGSTLTGSSTTSLFSGSATLGLGRLETGASPILSGVWPFSGRFHRARIYNGIAGTLVADFNASGHTPGSTSWSDGLGTPNTWVVETPAELTNQDYRFYGETADLPQEWDNTGTDVFVPIVASGITRRLMQGQAALDSALFRYLSALPNTGYWAFEDDSQAESLANATIGGQPASMTDVGLGFDEGLPASRGVVQINSTSSRVNAYCIRTTPTNNGYFLFFFKMEALPTADVDLIDVFTTGTAYRIRISVTNLGTARKIEAFDGDGVSLGSITNTHNRDVTQWIGVQVRLVDTGAGFDIEHEWMQVGGITFSTQTVTVATGNIGVPLRWAIGGDADLVGTSFASMQSGVTNYTIVNAAYTRAVRAFVGEYAAERFLRILRELGLSGYCIGNPAETQQMGRQPADTLLNLLAECAAVDRAKVYEPRDRLGYIFRTRRSLYRQAGPSIDYAADELSGKLRPRDDDQLIRNDVKVTRPLGSSARSERYDGPLGIDEAGRYDSAITRNAYQDSQLARLAGMETYLGTWDETRYPQVEVELARNVFLTTPGLVKARALTSLDVGDSFTLTNLPLWLPPDDVAVLVQGYREVHRNRGHEFRWNTGPAGPYLAVNNTLSGDSANPYRRAAAVDSDLVKAVDSDDTELLVYTWQGPRWGTTAGKPQNFPMDVEVGGEVMTVSGITNAITDDMGRTVASGLGSADVGGAYTLSGGAAGNYAVSTGLARITNASTNVDRIGYLGAQSMPNFDFTALMSVSAVALTQPITTYLVARFIDASNHYRIEAVWNTGSTVDLRIRRVLAGVVSTLGTYTAAIPYSAGTQVRVRAQAIGTLLRAKIELASVTASEKSDWRLEVTDSGVTGDGYPGFGSTSITGNTNTNPEARFDSFYQVNPQRLAISARSVNGVVKSQSIATQVQVKNRFYAAL